MLLILYVYVLSYMFMVILADRGVFLLIELYDIERVRWVFFECGFSQPFVSCAQILLCW